MQNIPVSYAPIPNIVSFTKPITKCPTQLTAKFTSFSTYLWVYLGSSFAGESPLLEAQFLRHWKYPTNDVAQEVHLR